MSAPTPTRCPQCGTLAAEIVCHICKRDKRPEPDADARGLHAAQVRHDVRCKIGAGNYP